MPPLVATTRAAIAGSAFSVGLAIGMAAPNAMWRDTLLVSLGAAGVLWLQRLTEVIQERR